MTTRWERDQTARGIHAALAAHAKRIGELEADLAGARYRVGEFEKRVELLEAQRHPAAIRALFEALDKLEKWRAKVEPMLLTLEREDPVPGDEPRRVPLSRAASRLGVSRDHVLRLARRGLLDLADLREDGAPQALWTVSLERVEALLETRRARPARLADPNRPAAGRHRADA